MIRYLLGQLGPDEQAELDERAFVDDAWAEKVELAADDLIDAYLGGSLGADARHRFEVHFLDSEARRERFRLIRGLRAVAAREAPACPAPARGWSVAAWAAAAVLVLATLTGLFYYGRWHATRQHLATAQPTAPTATLAPQVRPVPPEPSASSPAPSRTVTIAVPDPARAVAIAVGPELRTVRFAIPIPQAAAPRYSVTVRHEGQTVWQREDLVPQGAGAPLEVGIPAEVLASGATVLSIEPERVRGASPDPHAVTREWVLRIVRR